MNILFTGAGGPAAVGAIKSLQDCDSQNKHKIVSVDCDELAVGFHLSDKSYVVPKTDDELYYTKLVEVINKENIDLVLPTSDDVIPISWAENWFISYINLFLSGWHCVNKCTDKFLFYETCCEKFPLPTTTNKSIFKKPNKGKGSRGVKLIDNSKEKYIYQEYLPGVEYTIDVLCDMDSNVLSTIPRIRLQTKAGISTKAMIIRNENIESQCREIAKFLELKGAVCMQMKEDKNGNPKFIEINPRFGGGTYFTTLAGVNFIKIILDLIDGKEVKVPEPNEVTILRYFNEVVV